MFVFAYSLNTTRAVSIAVHGYQVDVDQCKKYYNKTNEMNCEEIIIAHLPIATAQVSRDCRGKCNGQVQCTCTQTHATLSHAEYRNTGDDSFTPGFVC